MYAASQFRAFSNAFTERFANVKKSITQNELLAMKKFNDLTNRYKPLISQNMAHCWAHTAVNNSSTNTASEMCEITQKLHEAAQIIDPEDSQIFDAGNPNWLQFHLLDLHAVEISFQAYLKKHGKDIGSKAYQAINSRLLSIQNFCKEYQNEQVNPTTSRIFSPIPINYSTWIIDPNDLEEKKIIGSGVSANVYFGIIKSTKQKVAIKKLKYAKLTGLRFRGYQREITVLATAVHPTLLKFFGATEYPPYRIVTEWMSGGNLYHELHNYHKLNNTDLSICAFDIARGMNFLHSKQIVHRDLKSLNVLLDDQKHAKICDFGFSRKLEKKAIMTKNVGTPHWISIK
ncbi:TKL family protein kinase [Histomonas meleagridis]|nr:TKL family protein kinase [Histomonas meleagridis]